MRLYRSLDSVVGGDEPARAWLSGPNEVRTACAKVGSWRWRFLTDSPVLTRIDPVGMTVFRVQVETRAVDLRKPPFDRDATAGAIVYRSVRDPEEGTRAALLTPAAFVRWQSEGDTRAWSLAVRSDGVSWRRGFGETFAFAAAHWRPPDA